MELMQRIHKLPHRVVSAAAGRLPQAVRGARTVHRGRQIDVEDAGDQGEVAATPKAEFPEGAAGQSSERHQPAAGQAAGVQQRLE